MTVIAGVLLYDVTNPVEPRLVCKAQNTFMQLVPGNAIVYTKAAAGGKAAIVRLELATGAESEVALLPSDPRGSKTWTPDGLLEVYAGRGKPIDEYTSLVPIHLWTGDADRVIYSVITGLGGIESRWSVLPIVEFSPNRAFVAVSDAMYSIRSTQLRIFSVANPHGTLVGDGAHGGTWVADDKFVWATSDGTFMQWTPAGGVAAYRSEKWFGPTRSADAKWVAGTLLANASDPHVLIAPVAGGAAIKTRLGSAPSFVTPTVVWYVGEKLCGPATDQCGADPTLPDGTVRAYNLTTRSDQLVFFTAGEHPLAGGGIFSCCTTRV